MWEVMNACVILHNMINESYHESPQSDTELYERMCPLSYVYHQVPPAFAAFVARRQEVWDANTHHQLQYDVVEHLWRLKGAA
jgi:hypothetical protein